MLQQPSSLLSPSPSVSLPILLTHQPSPPPSISPLLNHQSLHLSPSPQPLFLRLLKFTLIILGILWGIPWIQSCYSALSTLHIYSSSTSIGSALIVAYSIITISIDGIWIMTSIYKVIFQPVKIDLELRDTYRIQRKLLFVSFIVGLISSVPGVYASYQFNEGARKYLAVIILFGNVGLATFGFYSMGFQLWERVGKRGKEKDGGIRMVEEIQGKYHRLIQHYNKNKMYDTPLYQGEYKDLAQFVSLVRTSSQHLPPPPIPTICTRLLSLLPLLFGILIASAQSLIDILLTYNLLHSLHFPSPLSYILSSLMTIPNLFVSFISSRQVFSKLISLLSCRPSTKLDLTRTIPYIDYMIFIVSMLALFSPLAGCYITWKTLSEAGIGNGVVIGAVVMIFLARFCFSNFTIRLVCREVFGRMGDKRGKREEERVGRVWEVMGKVHPKYFEEEVENQNKEKI